MSKVNPTENILVEENAAVVEEQAPMVEETVAAAPRKSKKNPNKIKDAASDKVLDVITTILLVIITILVAYPVIFVVSASFSSNSALLSGRVVLLPVEPTLDGYKMVFSRSEILDGFRNTLFYTVFGTLLKMFMQITCAYPLSRPHFKARKLYTKIIVLTMLVNAGMIPLYLVKKSLGLIDNVWAILISGLIGASNVFILRTAFRSSIPGELFDAAMIDGANEYQCLLKIAIPLSKATISVVTLYAIVGCWNEYFTALIYLPTRSDLWPLQLHLRNLLVIASQVQTDTGGSTGGSTSGQSASQGLAMMRYALIVVATVPVLAVYALVQKYFKGGVMVGSVKG